MAGGIAAVREALSLASRAVSALEALAVLGDAQGHRACLLYEIRRQVTYLFARQHSRDMWGGRVGDTECLDFQVFTPDRLAFQVRVEIRRAENSDRRSRSTPVASRERNNERSHARNEA